MRYASNKSTRIRKDEKRNLGKPGRPVAMGYMGAYDERQTADADVDANRDGDADVDANRDGDADGFRTVGL